ncbi:MAG: DUF4261 domain-containing protein [Planctomycetota bacterium]
MAKGLFTQGMCVLCRADMPLEEIQSRLTQFELVGIQESSEDDDSPRTLAYSFRPDVSGHMLVTPSSIPWPDDMGDPDESPERFVAWSLGQFGPLAFPGCLERAAKQSWGWDDAIQAREDHECHVRLLISYVMVGEDDDDDDDSALVPDDYDAVAELHFLTKAASALLESPTAICYFNPGGEVLRDESGLRQGLNYAWNHDLPPLDMWTNVRMFIDEEQWVIMDTVGNGQFDLPDMEAIYHRDDYEASEVESFLRHASLYLLTGGEDVGTGDTADGPGEIAWRALECGEGLSDPPRPTIRWFPENGRDVPEPLLDPCDVDDDFDEDEFDDAADLALEPDEFLPDSPADLLEDGEYDFLNPHEHPDSGDDDEVDRPPPETPA